MQVVLDFAKKSIVVDGEGPELVQLFSLIREIAPQLPSITFTSTGASGGSSSPPHGSKPGSSTSDGDGTSAGLASQTLRQFVRSLSLGSHPERITAIAYYQAHVLSKPTFTPKEMEGWFTQCGLEKPTQMGVAIFDSKKRNGFAENAGHGAWRLSTQGENFIIRKMEEASEAAS